MIVTNTAKTPGSGDVIKRAIEIVPIMISLLRLENRQ
jgi:hypothetical protein